MPIHLLQSGPACLSPAQTFNSPSRPRIFATNASHGGPSSSSTSYGAYLYSRSRIFFPPRPRDTVDPDCVRINAPRVTASGGHVLRGARDTCVSFRSDNCCCCAKHRPSCVALAKREFRPGCAHHFRPSRFRQDRPQPEDGQPSAPMQRVAPASSAQRTWW